MAKQLCSSCEENGESQIPHRYPNIQEVYEAVATVGRYTSIVKAIVTGNTKRDHPDTPIGVLSEIERRKDLQARKISGDGDGESESTSGRDVIFFDLRIDMDTNVC